MSQFPPDSDASGADHLRQKADEVRAQAAHEGAALKDKAKAGLHDAKDAAIDKGESAKNRAADEISRTSDALRAAARELDDGSIQHQMFTEASNAVGSVSTALTDRSISEIVEDLAQFGRRNPAAVIGGAVLAGLIVSRFARASAKGTNATAEASPQPVAPTYRPKETFHG
ncbi:hypothetical protein [Falsirhodobacter halotolerans]|uniref:hypothetical protein n=1 Tax=Falsirhodobacter halotolerans TaxID=1146892 RepID=UPI001FD20D3E|nr:hypothetical protein [Falsirhodobacter halotolerans]MCJ8139184.1 hypothetical protein [Falsirhodobacter halotolerans]